MLVALLFGFTAIARRSADLEIPSSARLWFYAGLGAFTVAAVFGLLTNRPLGLKAATPEDLRKTLRERWSYPEWMARRRIAATRLKLYEGHRSANATKANTLRIAIACEVVAVLFLGVGVGLVIANI